MGDSKKCCACKKFVCENTNNPLKLDKFGKGCGDYAKNPVQYCAQPKLRDSATFSYTDCCACEPKYLMNWQQTTAASDKPAGLSTNAIAGITTGVAVGLVLIVAIVVAVAVVKSKSQKKTARSNSNA